MDNIIPIVESLGLPATIIAVLIFAIYKTARWLAPKFESLFSAHVGLVTDLQEQTRQQTDISKRTLELVGKTHTMISKLPTNPCGPNTPL